MRWRVAFKLLSISHTAIRETGVEAGGGLVEKKDAGIVDQTTGNFNAAAHTAGEGLNLRAAPLDQVDGFQDFVDAFFALYLGHAVEFGIDAEVFFDGKVGGRW